MLEHDILVGAELELELPISPRYHKKNAYAYIYNSLVADKCQRYDNKSVAGHILDLGIFKYDNTINCGFEYATIPFVANYVCDKTNKSFEKVFTIFKKYKTKIGDHLGMHVHVNKKALTNEQIEKLNYFVYRNSDFCKLIGERDFNKYCRLEENQSNELTINNNNHRDDRYIVDVNNKKNHKHRMLNVARPSTIEFRFFKSTNDYYVFLKNMQFVIALINFVKTSKSSLDTFRIGGATMVSTCDGICYDVESGLDIITNEFCWYVEKHRKTYKQLHKFLVKKKII